MGERRFKVGDRVRDISYNNLLATVVLIGDGTVGVHYDGDLHNDRPIMFPQSDYVLVAKATGTDEKAVAEEPKFKVGDRVRVITKRHGNPQFGMIGTVVETSRGGVLDIEIEYDKPFGILKTNQYASTDLELIDLLTIQTGRYYKTRDGRKVGPMHFTSPCSEWPWEAKGYEDYCRSDGTTWDGRAPENRTTDLVAEWVDEPAATASPTTGFTIPLPEEDDDPDSKLLVSISADTSALDSEIDRILKRLKKLKKRARKMGIDLEYSELRDAA